MSRTDLMEMQENYNAIIKGLNAMGWKYSVGEYMHTVSYTVTGNGLPMSFMMTVDGENRLISVMSKLPIKVESDKYSDIAMAVCYANYKMADGCFHFDREKGHIYFKMSASYLNSVVGNKLIEYLANVSASTVDRYDDKFLAIANGDLTIIKFME